MAKANRPNELRLVRVFQAPREVVWGAWTDPAQLAQWWGPRGFTITTHARDFRTGGFWSYTMHGPDGVDYENRTTYLEIEPERRMVYDHGATADRPPLFRVAVTFEALADGRTEMDMTMALATPEAAAEIRGFIKQAGGESTWDRLAEFVGGDRQFITTRSFITSVDTLFSMWAEPEHAARWLAPKGFSMRWLRTEHVEGGTSLHEMSDGRGMTLRGRLHFLTIDRPNTLVYTQQFLDERGEVTRHPGLPVWPAQIRTTVIFADEGHGEARATVYVEPEGDVTPEERTAFLAARGGMTRGWAGAFDQLDVVIAG